MAVLRTRQCASLVTRVLTISKTCGSFLHPCANSLIATCGFLTENEEKGLTGAFSFVSPGAHLSVGLSETEMVRLGRSLVVSMCYFLAKRYNA